MNNKFEIDIIKQLKNAEGKRLLQKTILEYSKEIIKELKQDPKLLNEITEKLEISEEEFLDYLSGEKKTNVVLYDQALLLIKTRANKRQLH